MAITGRDVARALERANVCSSKQAEIIARELDLPDEHAVLHDSIRALWEQASAPPAPSRGKPGPKPKAAEPQA